LCWILLDFAMLLDFAAFTIQQNPAAFPED